jgi:hypothetical protein
VGFILEKQENDFLVEFSDSNSFSDSEEMRWRARK